MIVALILARGGSKRLPGKNLARVGHETLVARAVACAHETPEIDVVVLSTDADDIALEGFRHGAVVVKRPEHLAGDNATSEEGCLHALDAIGAMDDDTVVLLQPTSPLRTSRDVSTALQTFFEHPYAAPAVISTDEAGEINGAVYITDVCALRAERTFNIEGAEFLPMPNERSIDIDTREDLERAQLNWDG